MSREVEKVADAYLEEWFYTDSNNNLFFLIPPVSIRQKVTQFISGRHRTAVLLQHLNEIPLSYDSRFIIDDEEEWIWTVASKPVDMNIQIELPDLPIKASLP